MKLKTAMKRFEAFLQSHDTRIMESFHPYFREAFWEMVKNGGKRFRPSLIFSVVCAKNPKIFAKSLPIALAVESLHTYSLIHDDLPAMDNAALRRNHPTLHTKYDECGAILAGDALNTYAFYLIASANLGAKMRAKITESLSFGGVKMVLGQALDCYFENTKLSQERLRFVHINKTARLIAASLEIGGILAEMPKREIKKLYDFGLNLGLFFQIRDDIIDATAESAEAGKPTHNDFNKNSYVNLLGLGEAKNAQNALKNEMLKNLRDFDKGIRENLLKLLESYT